MKVAAKEPLPRNMQTYSSAWDVLWWPYNEMAALGIGNSITIGRPAASIKPDMLRVCNPKTQGVRHNEPSA